MHPTPVRAHGMPSKTATLPSSSHAHDVHDIGDPFDPIAETRHEPHETVPITSHGTHARAPAKSPLLGPDHFGTSACAFEGTTHLFVNIETLLHPRGCAGRSRPSAHDQLAY